MPCKHCGDELPYVHKCPTCGQELSGVCEDCHAELAHGKIANQNIVYRSPNPSKLNQPDGDPDAWGRADRE